ncbi:MAG: hypothetical protein F6K47_42915, partial [Symploca sp. SIO2E6]|nr:hypothetical protein [Symploca sp. SIO2E6]
ATPLSGSHAARMQRGGKRTSPSGAETRAQRSQTSRKGEGASCSTTSFAAGTEIATAEGEKAIESIAVGDLVWAYDEETGTEGEYPVVQLFTRIAPESVVISFDDTSIVTTPEHEFYTLDGWVKAKDLAIGDVLLKWGGETVTVTGIQLHGDSTRVYNFEVDKAHTYYVSIDQVLVHNPNGCAGSSNSQAPKPVLNLHHPMNFRKVTRSSEFGTGQTFDVLAHGNSQQIFYELHGKRWPDKSGNYKNIPIDHVKAASIIKNQPGYNGQNVRLFACNTGNCANGFAQQLANRLRVDVIAPTKILWADSSGRITIAEELPRNPNVPRNRAVPRIDMSRLGTWKVFKPQSTP